MNATDLIVDICRKRKKKFAFLINAYDGRPQFRKANTEAIAMLAGRGPIFETRLPYSAKFLQGQSSGKTGPELDKALATSVDALLEEVKAMISKPEHHGALPMRRDDQDAVADAETSKLRNLRTGCLRPAPAETPRQGARSRRPSTRRWGIGVRCARPGATSFSISALATAACGVQSRGLQEGPETR